MGVPDFPSTGEVCLFLLGLVGLGVLIGWILFG